MTDGDQHDDAGARFADGSEDGRWWSAGDDDGRLKGSFKNLIPWEFVDRIAHAKTTFLPPAGNQVGDA